MGKGGQRKHKGNLYSIQIQHIPQGFWENGVWVAYGIISLFECIDRKNRICLLSDLGSPTAV